jgi:isopenicillin N synthase-like dioxygenase
MAASDFPIVDLSRFEAANTAGRAQFGVEVDGICRATGFLAISGHGVPQATIDAAWNAARTFFDLPLEEKQKAKAPYAGYPYGYLGHGVEALAKSKGADTPPDLKESFNGGPLSVPPGLADPEALAFCYADTIGRRHLRVLSMRGGPTTPRWRIWLRASCACSLSP